MALAGPWPVKLEYLHYDLNSNNFTIGGVAVPNSDLSVDTIKIGLNYCFNWF